MIRFVRLFVVIVSWLTAVVGLPLVAASAVGAVDGTEPVSTVAGGNGSGSGADQLATPRGIAVGADGSLYIADGGNSRVQVVSPSGAASTVPGALNVPTGVALSGEIVYVADTDNHRVQKIDFNDASLLTVAGGNGQGSGANQLDTPFGVAVGPDGSVYVADTANHRVQKINVNDSSVSTVAGGNGSGAGANQLSFPSAVAVGSDGSVYVTDSSNHRVQRISAGGVVSTVAGGNGAGAAANQLVSPVGVALDADGTLYVADQGNHRVQRITAGGVVSTVAGGNGSGAAANQLSFPLGVALDGDGSLYVSDSGNHRVQKLTAFDTMAPTIGVESVLTVAGGNGDGSAANQLDLPRGVALGADGSLYVTDSWNHRVQRISAGGVVSTVAGGNGAGAGANQLFFPSGVAVGGDGSLYVVDTGNDRVQRVSSEGVVSTVAGGNGAGSGANQLFFPWGVAVGGDGSLYVVDSGNDRVQRVSSEGVVSTVAGGNGDGAGANQLFAPTGVAIDGDGSLYVVDSGNDRVQRVSSEGVVSTVAGGNGAGAGANQLFAPTGIAIDGDGSLYVADNGNHRVQRVLPPEVVAPLGVRDSVVVSVGDLMVVGFECADEGTSGLVSCVGTVDGVTVANGDVIPTGAAGPVVFEVVAVDGAGNRTVEQLVLVVSRGPADDQILRLYQAVFGRAPDAGGFDFWTGEYRGGRSLSSIVDAFIASSEFTTRYGASPTDAELVDAMYLNVLGRAGDAGGVAFWLDQLSDGLSVNALLQSFADSSENIDGTATSEPLSSVESKVLRLYRAVFGRAPDDGGFRFWVDQAAGGRSLTDIAGSFAASPEFEARYGASPSDRALVDALYENVLGRAGDAGGVEFWLGQRAAGVSVAELLVAFADSDENLLLTGTRP